MNERIRLLAEQAGLVGGGYANGTKIMTWRESFDNPGSLEKFAELLLKKTFTIIAESMIDTDADLKIDEIIADRLDEAAVDVCDELGIMNGIYRV